MHGPAGSRIGLRAVCDQPQNTGTIVLAASTHVMQQPADLFCGSTSPPPPHQPLTACCSRLPTVAKQVHVLSGHSKTPRYVVLVGRYLLCVPGLQVTTARLRRYQLTHALLPLYHLCSHPQSVIRNAVKQAPRAVAAPGPSGAQTRTASQAGVPNVQSTASPRSGDYSVWCLIGAGGSVGDYTRCIYD